MDGDLWVTNLPMALTLAATLPPGLVPVVRIRREITDLVGPKFVPGDGRLVDAAVVSIDTFKRLWLMGYIYVGHGQRGPALIRLRGGRRS